MSSPEETSAAIYSAILGLVREADNQKGVVRATMVRDAAIAFAATTGGGRLNGVQIQG